MLEVFDYVVESQGLCVPVGRKMHKFASFPTLTIAPEGLTYRNT